MKIWFMYENHTFAKVTDMSPAALVACAKQLFKEDGCGCLFVHDETGTTISSLTFHGKRLHHGKYGAYDDDLERWGRQGGRRAVVSNADGLVGFLGRQVT
jgi:hypothetical protein